MNPRYPLTSPPDPKLLDDLTDAAGMALIELGQPAPSPSDRMELRQHLAEFLYGRVS